jgi:hypothetical protein
VRNVVSRLCAEANLRVAPWTMRWNIAKDKAIPIAEMLENGSVPICFVFQEVEREPDTRRSHSSMAGRSGDPTLGHRDFLTTNLRPLLKTIEKGLHQQGIRSDEDTPAALLLEVAVNFLVGEDSGRGCPSLGIAMSSAC